MPRTDFGSHAYWRVQCYARSFCALSAVAFKDGSGSLIATTGGTAIESSHQSTFTSANLFDGSDTTFWESNGEKLPWAGYHFASSQTVMQVGLQARTQTNMDNSAPPKMVSIEYSADGLIWQQTGYIGGPLGLTADVMSWFDLSKALP